MALAALKAIPGFTQVMRVFMKVWNEQQFKLINMSTNLKLGDNQMKKYYDMLSPICEKLWIEIPEIYVELNVVPNAYTYGDTKPFIVLTSGLIYRNNTCKNLAYGRFIFDTLKEKITYKHESGIIFGKQKTFKSLFIINLWRVNCFDYV